MFAVIYNLNNLNNLDENNSLEIILFILTILIVLFFTIVKQEFISKSKEFHINNKFATEYFHSLINSLNKAFLSLNLNSFSINTNKSFFNFLKTLGVTEEQISSFYKSENKKENIFYKKSNNFENKKNLKKYRNIQENKSLNSSDRLFLKKTNESKFIKNNSIKSLEKNENNNVINITKLNENYKVIQEKQNQINYENFPKNENIDEIFFNNKNSFNFNIQNNNEKNKNNEECFFHKLDFLLNDVFCFFFQEKFYDKTHPENKIKEKYESLTLSQAIREIFHSKDEINTNQCFICKGIFHSKDKKNLKSEKSKNFIIEVYYRKIKTNNGDLIEFMFNDITLTRNVEMEKAENTIKAMVLAKISHEFKTPLITIIYILKNYIKKNKNKNELSHFNKVDHEKTEEEDYINNTIDLSDYMLSLINDIVDYSVLNSEFEFKCQYDNFELHELLIFSYRILKILINCRGMKDYIHPILEINPNVPKTFCSDEKRLKQIILNLITNSIKFTRRGYIKISANVNRDNLLVIAVEDTGIGIQSQDIPKLFQDHSKLWDKTSAQMNKIGSGLGLSICKKIIEQIGKFIEVQSVPNKKTMFYFLLENKSAYKKSFSVNKSVSKNLANFKKNFMNVTTKSVKNKKLYNDSMFRPNSFNTNILHPANFIIKENINNEDIGSNKRLNPINIAKISPNTMDPIKVFNEDFLDVRNPISNSIMIINNNNKNNFNSVTKTISNSNFKKDKTFKETISECSEFIDDEQNNTKIFSETNMNFSYNLLTKRSLSSDCSSFDLRSINKLNKTETDLNSFLINKNKKDVFFKHNNITNEILKNSNIIINNINNSHAPKFKSEYNIKNNLENCNSMDHDFYKLIRPIKKFYERKKNDLILVVDDNKFLRKSLKNNIRSIFTDTSIDVLGCSDGLETLYLVMLDQLFMNKIKLIISDENMVYLNGTETNQILDNFTKDGKISSIPFALCSAGLNSSTDHKRKSINYILNKPPTKSELKSLFMRIGIL